MKLVMFLNGKNDYLMLNNNLHTPPTNSKHYPR